MRRRQGARLALVAGAAMLASACATGSEWATWRAHSAHFASGAHLTFSLRNREGVEPRVTRQDVALARREAWWGRPVTVTQEEILER